MKKSFQELGSLFFVTRQIIRQKLPGKGKPDPNEWLRLETLHFIAQASDPTMHEIARYVRVTAPSTTSLVKHLEKLGYVRRKHERDDKRIVRITITPKGKRALCAYAKRSADTMRVVFGALPEHDIRKLRDILQRLTQLHD